VSLYDSQANNFLLSGAKVNQNIIFSRSKLKLMFLIHYYKILSVFLVGSLFSISKSDILPWEKNPSSPARTFTQYHSFQTNRLFFLADAKSAHLQLLGNIWKNKLLVSRWSSMSSPNFGFSKISIQIQIAKYFEEWSNF